MGEATFYLKARFKDQNDLSDKMGDIAAFLSEGERAADFWQKHRGDTPKIFWAQFELQFPSVYDYLGKPPHTEDNHNGLAGQLDLVSPDNGVTFEQAGEELRYAAIVWHFADWDLLARYLKRRFGALEVGWISDEYLEPWAAIIST